MPVVKPDTSHLLARISRSLVKQGVAAYLVGGFVRDALSGRDTADIDIAVDADALGVAEALAAELGGTFVPLDEQNGVGRVVLPDSKRHVDFTTLRGDISQDLARRDFTIDAMAVELGKSVNFNDVIDPFHGRDDLRRGVVKAVSDDIFIADPVRLLRAVRIAAELHFALDESTESLVRRDSSLISRVPGERAREELLRLLALPGAGLRLSYLDKLGLLIALVPELAPSRGVEQPVMHVWDVFEHSIQTVGALEFLLRESDWQYASPGVLAGVPWSPRLQEHFDAEISRGSARRSLLKLAALLHDIAKPQTKAVQQDGRTRFIGHPQEGAAAASVIMERLRFSRREIQYVELLVKYHLRPTQMTNEGVPTRRAIYRFFRDTGDAGIDLLFLSLADHLAARGPSLDAVYWQEHTRITKLVLDALIEETRFTPPPKLVDGNDIMKAFGLSPGPRIGELLEALKEAQAAGEVAGKPEALDYVARLLGNAEKNRLKD